MILYERKLMNNGLYIPTLGLGTWKASVEEAAMIVKEGVKLGYRHFDTARAYGNEIGVGNGIYSCGVDRNKLFITSKIPAEIKTYESAKQSIKESIRKLDTPYIDLMLIHWPWPWDDTREYNNYYKENLEVWRAMEDAVDEGLLKSIGVSNFSVGDLDNIISNCRIKPQVHQILVNVNNTPSGMLDYCAKQNIVVEAYSPNGNGKILSDERLVAMAEKYGVSVAQLCVKYTLQLGLVSLPKTTNVAHMKSNTEMDFTISAADMSTLSKLSEK